MTLIQSELKKFRLDCPNPGCDGKAIILKRVQGMKPSTPIFKCSKCGKWWE